MAPGYESVRHDRWYEVDARGVAEFGPDRALQRFIPWCDVTGIEFTHVHKHRQVDWSVRAADGTRIRPNLEYANSLECYKVAVRTWRAFMPHACRAHFARVYRRIWRTCALFNLTWVIPVLFVYAFMGPSHPLIVEMLRESIGSLNASIVLMYAISVFLNLVFVKGVGLDFDRWYALMEARFTDLRGDSPVSSFAFLPWIFPAPTAALPEGPVTDAERSVYHRWEQWSALPLFILVPLLGYAWYLRLNWAASLYRPEAPDTRFFVQPGPIFWAMPAFLLGMISSVILLDGLYRALLRGRYRRFQRCCTERLGFDARRLFLYLAVMVFVGSAIFSLAAATSFSRFTETGVEIAQPLSLRTSFYEYSRVKAIEHRATFQAPIGNIVKYPHHVILFDDGTSWSSRKWFRDPMPEVDGQITQLVSQRSKRPIIKQP
jgi:hypothetical protein